MTDGLYYLSSDTTLCIDGEAILTAGSSDSSFHTYDWSVTESDDGPIMTLPAADAPIMIYITATNEAGCVSPIDSIFVDVSDSIRLCIGCARDGLDRGDSYGPGDIIYLVDQSDCQCSVPGCDHIDHVEEPGEGS